MSLHQTLRELREATDFLLSRGTLPPPPLVARVPRPGPPRDELVELPCASEEEEQAYLRAPLARPEVRLHREGEGPTRG